MHVQSQELRAYYDFDVSAATLSHEMKVECQERNGILRSAATFSREIPRIKSCGNDFGVSAATLSRETRVKSKKRGEYCGFAATAAKLHVTCQNATRYDAMFHHSCRLLD